MPPAKERPQSLDGLVNKLLLIAILGFVNRGTALETRTVEDATAKVAVELGQLQKAVAETKLEVLTLRAAFEEHKSVGDAWKHKIETRLARAGK